MQKAIYAALVLLVGSTIGASPALAKDSDRALLATFCDAGNIKGKTCTRAKGYPDARLRRRAEWSCMCDDDCPHCSARHMSPCRSEDMSEFIERDGAAFVVLRSPETAEHDPDYRELGRFPTRAKAEEFLATYEES